MMSPYMHVHHLKFAQQLILRSLPPHPARCDFIEGSARDGSSIYSVVTEFQSKLDLSVPFLIGIFPRQKLFWPFDLCARVATI